MRKFYFILAICLLSSFYLKSQDIIVLNDGTTILSKVLEISSSEIKYKKHRNLNGPTYTLQIDKVLAINYDNGEKDSFTGASTLPKNVQEIYSEENNNWHNTSSNNSELIKAHNKDPFFTNLKPKNKNTNKFFPIMAITDTSKMSSEAIEMSFIPHIAEDYDFNNRYRLKYFIRLKNKTNKIIYIDKASCFRQNNNEAAKSYYSQTLESISLGSQSGLGVGTSVWGGSVGFGTSSSNTETTIHSQQRIISIPPNGEVNLVEYTYDDIRKIKTIFTKNYKIIFDIETWDFNLSKSYELKKQDVLVCSPDDSPYKCKYHITYSFEQDFKTNHYLSIQMYAKYLVGIDYNTWDEVFSYNRIKKYISNFIGLEGKPDILIGQPNKVLGGSINSIISK